MCIFLKSFSTPFFSIPNLFFRFTPSVLLQVYRSIKRGFFYGVIAGVGSGVVGTISWIIGMSLRIWEPIPSILSATSLTTRLINEIVIAVAFGAIFGVLYSMYYDATPGKGILKGLVFGLLLFFISSVRFGFIGLAYYGMDAAIQVLWPGFFTLITFGLVLGYLYKKGD